MTKTASAFTSTQLMAKTTSTLTSISAVVIAGFCCFVCVYFNRDTKNLPLARSLQQYINKLQGISHKFN